MASREVDAAASPSSWTQSPDGSSSAHTIVDINYQY